MTDSRSVGSNMNEPHIFKGPEWVGHPMRFRTTCSCGWEKVVHSTALSAVEAEHIREIERDD